MKSLSLFLLFGASFGWTQTAPPAPPAAAGGPDKVVAIFADDGTKMTQAEFDVLISALPDSLRDSAQHRPQAFLHWYGVTKKAARLFGNEKLGDRPDVKAEMDFTVLEKMADLYVRITATATAVTPEELRKYYDEHKDMYKRVKVSALEVAFGGEPAAETGASSSNASRVPGKKTRTEADAKAKAEKLVAQLRAGGDFAKMEIAEDDNDDLKAKHGDEGTWGMTDNVPDLIRSNVLNLKEGETAEPLRQNDGYYILHADSVTYAPLAEVKDSVFAIVQQQKAKDWLEKFGEDTKVTFPDKQPETPAGPSDLKK